MEGSTQQFILLTFTCAFSFCFAEVALGVEVSPETTSFHHTATSAQPLSFYHSSSHQGTTVHVNSTGSLETTPISHRTTVQTAGQHQVTAPGHHTTSKAGATTTQVTKQNSTLVSTTPADTTANSEATTQAMETVTPTAKNTTTYPTSSDMQTRIHSSTETAVAATNTTTNNATTTQATAAAVTTTAISMQTVKPTTGSRNQTTAPESPTTTARTNTTTIHPGTQTTIPSTTMTVRPTLAPQPSSIPTGTYIISNGTRTCIKMVMGLQLMAQNPQKLNTAEELSEMSDECFMVYEQGTTLAESNWAAATTGMGEQMEYVVVNPNKTLTSGSCGMTQSELNITFSGGFVNFTFVKQAPSYYVSKIGTRLQLSFEGMLYYAAIEERLFTTKLGNSFKCTSKQIFSLEKNFQLLFINMQLQAFDMVSNQFGKEEECFLDKNSKAAPIAVGLSILGLFVIVFATFLISRRKPQRGYERI